MIDKLSIKTDKQIIGINLFSEWLLNEIAEISKLDCNSSTRLSLQTVAMVESLYRQGMNYDQIKLMLMTNKIPTQ